MSKNISVEAAATVEGKKGARVCVLLSQEKGLEAKSRFAIIVSSNSRGSGE